ncbi:piggyBac transposable element-derived protein 4-like [Halyomorpha halys]|uniref:piggyBac transposable element-derived protein 4-like n=1 Tax=Halyomorpha halys TaxID=286706 RepID=UPI0006D5076D
METKRNDTELWAHWLEELGKDVEENEIGESDPDDTEDYHVAVSESNTDSETEGDGGDESDIDAFQVCFEGRDGKTIWTSTPTSPDSKRPANVPHQPHTKGKGKSCQTFLDSFSCIIDDNIIRLITNYTNLNIETVKSNFTQQSDACATTEVEIAALLGLIYLIGLKSPGRGNIEDLWDQHGVGMEVFYLTMSCKRYRFLMSNISFHDPRDLSLRSELDKLAPIREVLEVFVHNCQNSLSPGELLTIDDMLVEFKGKCPFRQYMPKKRRSGIKLLLLVDTRTMYTHNIEIFVPNQADSFYKQENSPHDIAKRLIQPICGSHRNVTFDSWFTDVNLTLDLLKNHQVTCIGSISKNKMELPIEFVKRRKSQGNLIGFLKDESCCSLISCQDMGKINLYLSTRQQEASNDTPEQVISLYKDTKQAVSELYRMSATYSVVRTCRRWPLTIFYHLLNIAGTNGITIHKANNHEEKITRTEYLKGLALELIKPHIAERTQKDSIRKNLKRKMNYFLGLGDEEIPLPKRVINNPGRCYVCSRKRDRKTRVVCNTCQKFICKEHYVIVCARCFRTQEDSSSEDQRQEIE